jgi:hypothetical protein
MTRAWWVLALGLGACGGGKDKDSADTGTDGGPGACSNNLLTDFPADGTSDAYHRTLIDYRTALPEPEAAITLTDSSGAAVEGTFASDGFRHTFTPSAALAAGGSYTATLSWSCGDEVKSFVVSSAVDAAIDGGAVVGQTFSMDLRAARGASPDGVDAVLESLLQFPLLIGFTADNGGTLSMIGAVADTAGAQDACSPSIPFANPATFDQNPYFVVEADSLPIVVSGATVEITDMTLSGSFRADLSAVEGLRLIGTIDTRPLAEVIGGPGAAEGAVCDLFSGTFRIDCVECRDGSGTFCIDLELDDMVGPNTGFTLREISAAEAEANPDCPTE